MIKSIEEGRKEDGNRSIADKIIRRLHDLDKTVENNKGRWAWELLQNAKDSIADLNDKVVSVEIELNNDRIEFRHNGIHFTEQDVRGLINQISSKEVEDHQTTKKTGRFGTGFITTHLLSRIIEVKGILKAADNNYYSFEFPLDRSEKNTTSFIPKIEEAWSSFHASAKKLNSFRPDDFNTSFSYKLNNENQKDIARLGVEEFSRLVPYVLAFIPKISSVEVIDNVSNTRTKFINNDSQETLKEIVELRNGNKHQRWILIKGNERVSIAAEVVKIEGGYKVLPSEDIPKLFCDFPLIGSEKFYFPVVVNSFYFNPLTEREGIWLRGNDEDKEVKENQSLLVEAVKLFQELISYIEENQFFNLYNIAETRLPNVDDKFIDFNWYESNIQLPLRSIIFNSNLVELEVSGVPNRPIKNTWFPNKSYSKNEAEKIWEFGYNLNHQSVCKREHALSWSTLSWNEWNNLDYSGLVRSVAKFENITKLSQALDYSKQETFEWLNTFCEFLRSDDSNLHFFDNYPLIVNQNENLKSKNDKRGNPHIFIDKIKDKELIGILQLLGDDWKEILIHDEIRFGRYQIKEKKDIANRITEILKDSNHVKEGHIKAISFLSEWFDNNKTLGKELFSELYRKKADLFMNTVKDKEGLYQIMKSGANLSELAKVATTISSNPQVINDLTSLLQEFEVKNLEELRELLRSSHDTSTKTELTQEALASLGITSETELAKVLKDRGISELFTHTSTPTTEMFEYARSIVERAKDNIIKHISLLPDYDCTNCYVIAPSIIGGVIKNGNEITIVARPSDGNKVLLYYTSEFDVLEYVDAEFWCEDGLNQPKQITFGQILRQTGINRIPIRNINLTTPDLKTLSTSPKSEKFDFNPVPFAPEKIAKIVSSFANGDGGRLIFGMRESSSSNNEIIGLSNDFKVVEIIRKAISLLSPIPTVSYDWIKIGEKPLFIIETEKADNDILLDGRKYVREQTQSVLEKKEQQKKTSLNIPKFKRTIAIIITIENYKPRTENQISRVKYANNDALKFKNAVKEFMKVAEEDIIMYTDEMALKSDLEYSFSGLFHSLTEEDRLVFYYVGHGFHNGMTNYLSTYDMHQNNISATAISLNKLLLDPLRKSKCKTALIFIDACAKIFNDENERNQITNLSDEELILLSNEFPYYATFLSCQPGQSSYSSDVLKNGIFTHHLINAINGNVPEVLSSKKYVTDRLLSDYLSKSVAEFVKSEQGKDQNPKAIFDSSGENVIVELMA